jgi:hypothetical protein
LLLHLYLYIYAIIDEMRKNGGVIMA